MKYLAYGSNMVLSQMATRCPEAVFIGVGYIDCARLEFYLHATVEKTHCHADHVPVAVWEISDRDEQALDMYEGFPNYYRKCFQVAHMPDGSEIEGMIYIMREPMRHPASPLNSYYRPIETAYHHLGLRSQIKKVLRPALERSIDRCRPGTRLSRLL